MVRIAWCLCSTIAAATARSRFRAMEMFEASTAIDCATAKSTVLTATDADCVANCKRSAFCAKTGFDIGAWRKCLIDLTPYCEFYPAVFFGAPISVKDSFTESADDTVTFKMNKAGIDDTESGRLMLRWAVPEELADECAQRTFKVHCGASDALNVRPEVVKDWRGRPYLTVKSESDELMPTDCDVTDEQNLGPGKSRCLYDEKGRFYASGAWSISRKKPRAIAGARTSTTFAAPLNVRDEWFIGGAPARFYDA